jgi:hypothetical protein
VWGVVLVEDVEVLLLEEVGSGSPNLKYRISVSIFHSKMGTDVCTA